MSPHDTVRLHRLDRRAFARLAGMSGLLAWLDLPALEAAQAVQMPPAPAEPDEKYWELVRQQFLMPRTLSILNAANLCPTSLPVIETVTKATREVDADPSMPNRRALLDARETTRKHLAAHLGVTPEEIVITRNTSEGNNIVSSGLDLKAGDDVIVSADNHPSLLAAWELKAKRFGFVVKSVPVASPHPGAEAIVDSFRKSITPATRVLAFTHVTSTVGDLFPARELCRLARERGILSVVDAAQSFGVLRIDLSDMQPDFFTGSSHKWPCGPREVGVLYINKAAEARLWPSVVSLYAGATGASRRFEGLGQRDDAAIVGFGEAMVLLRAVGAGMIDARARELAQALMDGVRALDGVKIWTHRDPARSAAIVTFQPGTLDAGKLVAALYQNERIACTARTGADRPGVRVSPHFYNSPAEIDRFVAAIRKYLASGV